MPLLVNKLIFTLIPQRAPWILRPILRFVFSSLSSQFLEPRLIIHANYVSSSVAIVYRVPTPFPDWRALEEKWQLVCRRRRAYFCGLHDVIRPWNLGKWTYWRFGRECLSICEESPWTVSSLDFIMECSHLIGIYFYFNRPAYQRVSHFCSVFRQHDIDVFSRRSKRVISTLMQVRQSNLRYSCKSV